MLLLKPCHLLHCGEKGGGGGAGMEQREHLLPTNMAGFDSRHWGP